MQKCNIVLINPGDIHQKIHVNCFREVAELLSHGLHDLGRQVQLSEGLCPDSTNIILGYHLLKGKRLPPEYDCIIYQLEELVKDCETPLPYMLDTLRSNCKIWDFNRRNIEFLKTQGINAIYKPLGYHPKMEKVPKRANKDIDVLFYGSTNQRRVDILKALNEHMKVKKLFGVYGKARDEWISRSKIVLSIYHYESKYFDEVRLSYLLSNRIFTIVEDTPGKRLKDALVFVPYQDIVAACQYFLHQDELRKTLAYKAYQAFKKYPESEFLRFALQGQDVEIAT